MSGCVINGMGADSLVSETSTAGKAYHCSQSIILSAKDPQEGNRRSQQG